MINEDVEEIQSNRDSEQLDEKMKAVKEKKDQEAGQDEADAESADELKERDDVESVEGPLISAKMLDEDLKSDVNIAPPSKTKGLVAEIPG